MKVSIGAKIFEGPWGGGNLFVKNLSTYLIQKGHKVTYDLFDSDIDIILLTDPRKDSESSTYSHEQVVNYLKYLNNEAIVIHRLNECDERKGTEGLNKYFVEANKCADQNVFVSSWLMNIYENEGIKNNNNLVIMSGADKNIFNMNNYVPWQKDSKLKIVTHHWGNNWNKGFNIYSKLDKLIGEIYYKDLIEFTFIGNTPKGFSFENTKLIGPLSGHELADAIKQNNLYLTASINEPSGNHHIEGGQCGLPILYIKSGGIPEFCNNFGLSFTEQDFEEKLNKIIENYDIYQNKMHSYPYNAEKMCNEYEDLFYDLISRKEEIIKLRKPNLEYLIHSKLKFQIQNIFLRFLTKNKILFKFFTLIKRVYLKIKSIIVN